MDSFLEPRTVTVPEVMPEDGQRSRWTPETCFVAGVVGGYWMLPKRSGGLLWSQQKSFSLGQRTSCSRVVLHVSCSSSV